MTARALVVFDLDGVLLDSEQMWNEAKQVLVEDEGGRWTPEAHEAMLGVSPVGVAPKGTVTGWYLVFRFGTMPNLPSCLPSLRRFMLSGLTATMKALTTA